jgi:hypothetical protein
MAKTLGPVGSPEVLEIQVVAPVFLMFFQLILISFSFVS